MLKEFVLDRPLELPNVLIPDGATITVGFSEKCFSLRISLCFTFTENTKSGIIGIHKDTNMKLPDSRLLDLMGLNFVSKKEILEIIVASDSIIEMRYDGTLVNKCTDMVGYVNNIPSEVFVFLSRSNHKAVLSAYGSDKPLIELVRMGS